MTSGNLGEEIYGAQFTMAGKPPGVQGAWPHCACLQEAETDECRHSAHFLLFIQFETPTHGLLLLPFGVGLPLQLNLSRNTPYIHPYTSPR